MSASSTPAFAGSFTPSLVRARASASSARAARPRQGVSFISASAKQHAQGPAPLSSADAQTARPRAPVASSRRGFLAAALGATAAVAAAGLAPPAVRAEAPTPPPKTPAAAAAELGEGAAAAAAAETGELASAAADIAAAGVAQAVSTAKAGEAASAAKESGTEMELSTDGEVDPFRDTLLRYLGYANECGESFRPFIGQNGVIATYVLASGYVVADSIYQTKKIGDQESAKGTPSTLRTAKMATAGADSLLWQSLASVAVPGYTINRVVHFSELLLEKSGQSKGVVRRWLPTLLGLGTIPFIIHPIDNLVHKALDLTTRPVSEKIVKSFETAKDDTTA